MLMGTVGITHPLVQIARLQIRLSLSSHRHPTPIPIPQQVDTIFVGQRGLGTVRAFLIGSFSQYILAYAPCAVMLVK